MVADEERLWSEKQLLQDGDDSDEFNSDRRWPQQQQHHDYHLPLPASTPSSSSSSPLRRLSRHYTLLWILIVLALAALSSSSARPDSLSGSAAAGVESGSSSSSNSRVNAQGEVASGQHAAPTRLEVLHKLNGEYDPVRDGGFGVGNVDLEAYHAELRRAGESFFPSSPSSSIASTASNSVRSRLDCFLARATTTSMSTAANASSSYPCADLDNTDNSSSSLPIPANIFATAEIVDPLPVELKDWQAMNPRWRMRAYDDAMLDEYVRESFMPSSANTMSAVGDLWTRLLPPSMPILKYDVWRLLALMLEGGVYTDADTRPLAPIDEWPRGVVDMTPPGLGLGFGSANEKPSLIVGIEWSRNALKPERNAFNPLFDRSTGVVQWTFGAAAGHPVLVDAVRRVVVNSRRVRELEDKRLRGEEGVDNNGGAKAEQGRSTDPLHFDPEEDRAVLEWTGPAVLTDAVARYLQTTYALSLSSPLITQAPHPVRVGDVLILPLTALHARTNRFEQALDWMLGRGWAPWTVLEGEEGGSLKGLVGHDHATSWWKQKMSAE